MSLSGLLPILYDQRGYGAIARGAASAQNTVAEAPFDAARPYLLAALHADVTGQQGRPVIVVSPRTQRAHQLYEGLLAYSPPGTPVLFFPAPDLLPYERIAPDPTIVGERLRVLATLRGSGAGGWGPGNGSAPIIVTSVFALMQPTMSPGDLGYAMRRISRGDRVNLHELLTHLVNLGYEAAVVVEAPGQFSRRGGIVDIYPPTSSLPIRIELFGDEVDSIRVFSPLTQRSERQAKAVVITPSCEIPLWRREEATERLRGIDTGDLREEVLEEWQEQVGKIEAGECFEGMELFMPYYSQPLASLADYLPELRGSGVRGQGPVESAPLLVLDDPELIRLEAQEIERQAAELYHGFVENGELPPGLLKPYLAWEEVAAHGRGLPTLTIGGGAEGAIQPPEFAGPKLYAGNIGAAITDIKKMVAGGSRVVIVSQQSGRLRELMEDEDLYPTLRKSAAPRQPGADNDTAGVEAVALSEAGGGLQEHLPSPPAPGSVNLLQGSVRAGWQLTHGDVVDLVLLTDA
jgi:transcription-repair coupling factor (superfamily II helicase)